MSLSTDREVRENLEAEDYLIQRSAGIVAQVVDWVGKGKALHAKLPEAADKAQILALLDNLKTELDAATAI